MIVVQGTGFSYYACSLIPFFFFQAEDGIRDIGVTGVQTCALPILTLSARMNGDASRADIVVREIEVIPNGREQNLVFNGRLENTVQHGLDFPATSIPEIGRASCRERV